MEEPIRLLSLTLSPEELFITVMALERVRQQYIDKLNAINNRNPDGELFAHSCKATIIRADELLKRIYALG